MNDDLVQRLRGLHVWPQSTADTYPDVLGPRRIKALYEIGGVAHEAADTIEHLQATIAALEQPTPELAYIEPKLSADQLRAALDARGLEIRSKNDG
jgi:hypothetical protein